MTHSRFTLRNSKSKIKGEVIILIPTCRNQLFEYLHRVMKTQTKIATPVDRRRSGAYFVSTINFIIFANRSSFSVRSLQVANVTILSVSLVGKKIDCHCCIKTEEGHDSFEFILFSLTL